MSGSVLFCFNKFIYLFIIFGCVGSSFLCEGFPQLRRAGAALHRGARASHYRGLSCCGAQAPDSQAQQLWLTDSVSPRHVGSSQTRARTRVPCIGRRILNHCTTREALWVCFYWLMGFIDWWAIPWAWVMFSWFTACLVILDWISDTVNFTLVNTRFFILCMVWIKCVFVEWIYLLSLCPKGLLFDKETDVEKQNNIKNASSL